MDDKSPKEAQIEARFKGVARSKTFGHILDARGLRNKKVLDIGCSHGEFLAHFGPGSAGLTIMPKEAEYGQARGLDVRLGNIEEPAIPVAPDEKFDAIFANNILEHMYGPYAFLLRLRGFLGPGGMAIIGVPCVPKIVSLWRFKKFRGSLALSHINFFTRDTLIKTIERAGWQVQSARSFHVAPAWLDRLLDPIAPHFYITATPDPRFVYDEHQTLKFGHE